MSLFSEVEFQTRVELAQRRMAKAGFAALLLTTEPDIRYFTGFLTRFWESPSRPWFVVLPAEGKPVAVIPAIGAALMAKTWVSDIRTWPAPVPEDDGVSLLSDTLRDLAKGGAVAMPMGYETALRMPLTDFRRVEAAIAPMRIVPDDGLVAKVRAVKSPAEIALIRQACATAGRAFDRLPEIAGQGVALSSVFRDFQRLCLEEGADWVPYLAGGAGAGGYDDVISPASDTPLRRGDVLMLDTGLMRSGYFCDYDRNWSVGPASAVARSGWAQLLEATEAGRVAMQPGARACDLFHAMAAVTGAGEGGRLGHGLGMQLTEGLSLTAQDQTVLEPGMVLTLEPGVTLPGGGIMVHEDDFLVTETGCEQLSPSAPNHLPEI